MKTTSHPNLTRYGLFVLGVVLLGVFLAAAAFGNAALAVIAGCFCVVAVATAMGLVGAVAGDQHHRNQHPPGAVS
ncbi:MAG: hypothetical protein WBQ44_20370 [Rhodococcus sp. (in: high G+C Gram-positive bacteria)]